MKQISEWEIYEIRILLKEWKSIPETALKVWRDKNNSLQTFKSKLSRI
jgi:hypothetical protein